MAENGVSSRINESYGAQSASNLSIRRISWGALFAGVVIATMVQLVMGLLGISVGAQTVNATGQPSSALGVGAAVWMGISTLGAFFVGGWVAARMAGIPRKTESVLHGLLTWGVSTLAFLFVIGTAAGSLIGGTASMLGGMARSSEGQRQISAAINEAKESIQGGQIDPGEAAQKAKQAGQQAAGPLAAGSFGGFLMLLLGGAAAAIGGGLGTPKNTFLEALPSDRRWHRIPVKDDRRTSAWH